jgi:hypothetical protein
MATYFDLVMLE